MLLVENIGSLLTANNSSLLEIRDASILIENEKIVWAGKSHERPKVFVDENLDAMGRLVVPGLIDCHSHLIFAGNRASEFAMRMKNVSYQSIMEKGGGIMSTVRATKDATDDALLRDARRRADAILLQGVTTLEAKSGYGLTLDDEMRALRLLKKLDDTHSLDIHRTFLGAHVVPPEYKDRREKYVSLIVDEMLEQIASEQLAEDCDVFCEKGAFSVDEARAILQKAHEVGLGLRAHVQQLSASGGVSLVNDLPIKSISHADYLSDADIELLSTKNVVVEMLPIAALFLRSTRIPPVEKLLKKSIKLSVATDFNPGSAMCHDLVFAARLAVTYFRLPIEEAFLAITKNAALSLGHDDIGEIKEGAWADLLITNCTDINEFFYDWTKHPAEMVIKKGKYFLCSSFLPLCRPAA